MVHGSRFTVQGLKVQRFKAGNSLTTHEGGKAVPFLFLLLALQPHKKLEWVIAVNRRPEITNGELKQSLLFRKQSFFDFCCQNVTASAVEVQIIS